ncbi:MAG: TolC family protein [Gemmatimonadota bacterium]|nr:TolC family protein [Gemmatimonadota bacterium]MDP6802453.1 TolC family protein [Gemmatimonadota bacterium]MDP7030991.1 TolC family protein [Gemmatimonadota bacterium]
MTARFLPGVRRAAVVAALWIPAAQTGAAFATSEPMAPGAVLDELRREVLAANPRLAAARHRWEAAEFRASVRGSFPDPRVNWVRFLESVETKTGPQTDRIGVRQRIPWPGRLDAREAEASSLASVLRAGVDDTRVGLLRDITHAWADLYLLDREVDITRENLDILIELERVLRQRYRTGTARHADLVKVQVELGELEDRLRSLEDRRRPVLARINALRRSSRSEGVPSAGEPRVFPGVPSLEEVSGALLDRAPRLRARDRAVDAAGEAERLARMEAYPDLIAGVDWIRTGTESASSAGDAGRDPVAVSFAVDLPVFRGRIRDGVHAAEASLEEARAARVAEEDRLFVDAEDALYRLRDAVRREELYRQGLLPKARESWIASLTAYEAARGGFLDLMDARRTLLAFELAHARARADRCRGLADLEAITGVDWAGREENR